MSIALGTFIRSIHLLFIASFLGWQIASYYYVITSQRSGSLLLQRYTLNLMLFIDCILLIIIAFIYITCSYLVYHSPTLSYTTPWIHAACVSLTIVVLCFGANMFIQYRNLKLVKSLMKSDLRYAHNILDKQMRLTQSAVKAQRRYNKIMHTNYVLIIFLLLLIIHDAVTHSTFLGA